ncbi:signal transduction histidine kinase [Marinilabilia salmonicolor]|jgi:signal transduction histidine kinase/ligand-binding sensor domain-containing protein/AraC-like DNA-binding protein|uniref:hybrid sensor histidine kinase/response regulator transcription factor n=1 Tax=Marinilabilia salmonicolor TaxID=989 RepID=UPI000D07EB93|nr:two-component regulator propeller domain-containing protein [Marinilabilia salmonicolor]PRZ00549.1 signal transduction histidine kinase [Marinilabilia salmonicolor]
MKSQIILFFFIISIAQVVSGKKQFPTDVRYEVIDAEDALSNGSVSEIIKDSSGYVWIGTYYGLNRYNGYEAVPYYHNSGKPNSLPNNFITSLFLDSKGTLWVGTKDGLCFYDDKRDLFEEVFCEHSSNPAKHIGTVFAGGKDGFYVGMMGGGLYWYSYKKELLRPVVKNMSSETRLKSQIYCGYVLSEDSVFVGTYGNGIGRYNSLTDSLEVYSFPGMEINCIEQAGPENLLLGTNNMGLYHFNIKSKRYENIPVFDASNQPVTIVLDIEKDLNGQFLIATDGAGVVELDGTSLKPSGGGEYSNKFNLFENEGVRALYLEESGITWVGTVGKGLFKYNPLFNQFLLTGENGGVDHSALNENVIDVFQDTRGCIWVGTDGGGLFMMEMDGRVIERFENFNNHTKLKYIDVVRRVYEDSEGDIWLGTYGNGISVFTPGKEHDSFQTFHLTQNERFDNASHVWSIEGAGEHQIWAGTLGRGLFRINKQTGVVSSLNTINAELDSFLNPYILSLAKDNKQRLWVGTSNGVVRISKDLNDFSVFLYDSLNNSGVGRNTITDIYHSKDGSTWLSTNGGGVVKVGENDSLTIFNTAKGLSHDKVYDVFQDCQQDYWIATYNGLNRYRVADGELLMLDARDGLNSSVMQVAMSLQNGYIMTGSPKGLNCFKPTNLLLNNLPPKVIFENLFVDNQEIFPDDESNILENTIQYAENIELTSENNSFALFFSGLNYFMPEKTRYSYRLLGLSEDWSIPSEERWARFNKLPPGAYTLQVKGMNNSGVWSDEPATLNIEILPPWYKTRFAFFGFLGIFGILVFAYMKYSIFLIEMKKNLSFEKKERLRMEELSEMRSQFFTNISHEFRTPLTLILLPVRKILSQDGLSPEITESLSGVAHNAGYLTQLIDQILEVSKIESGHLQLNLSEENFSKFCGQTVGQFKGLAQEKQIILKFNGHLSYSWLKFDKNVVGKIINNLLSNALKYCEKGGHVTFTLLEEPDAGQNSGEKMVGAKMSSSIVDNRPLKVGFKIVDDGTGISKENLDRLFNRYEQFGKAVNNYQQGTGIGLALVKQLVDLHNGDIKVTSKEGKGTSFEVFFKVFPVASRYEHEYVSPVVFNSTVQGFYTSNESEVKKSDKNPGQKSGTGEKHILLVEDNQDVLAFLTDELSSLYRVSGVKDGTQALDWLALHQADLVLSDVVMPNMDGIELCRKIKTNDNLSHIPVILLSARGESGDKIEGLEYGADLYLSKPFDMELLKAYVRGLILNREKMKEYLSSYLYENHSVDKKIDLIEEQFLKKVVFVIKANLDNEYFSVEDLCDAVGMSRSNLHRKLKAIVGKSTTEFIRSFRLKEAALLLSDTDLQVSEIAFKVGFSNVSHFIKIFRQEFSLSPSLYRKSKRTEIHNFS